MRYQVYDCLADCEVGIFKTLEEAEMKLKQWGGECTHVYSRQRNQLKRQWK